MEFSKVEAGASRSREVASDANGIPRHKGDGRPKIFPEGGGKGEYYTRVTTFIDALSDKSTLSDWKLRQTLKGLSRRPDLLEDYQKIGDPDGHDKWKALKIAETAMQAAGAGMKAGAGTEVHEAIEKEIGGLDWSLPPDIAPDVAAFSHTLKALGATFLATEKFGVNDEIKAAGTMDQIITLDDWETLEGNESFGYMDDTAVGADVKTGVPWWSKTAMQLAIYSRCQSYDPTTFQRSPLLPGWEVDQELGFFIHVPLGKGTCEVRPLDLGQGWEDVLLAKQVREARSRHARKASIPRVLASFSSDGESLATQKC